MIVYGWGGTYNKRDFEHRWGPCENCGRVGCLLSFTCTKFVSVFFVPLFPHGSLRFVEYCPSCKTGRAMPLSQWKKLRRTVLAEALDEFERNPADEEAAGNALDAVQSLGLDEDFARIAPHLIREFSHNPRILARAGWAFTRFGLREEGVQVIEASLRMEEHAEARAVLDEIREHPVQPPPRFPSRVWSLLPVLLLPGFLALFALVGFLMLEKAAPRHAILVNGTSYDYTVLINGEEVAVRAGGRKHLDVSYGAVRLAPAPGGIAVDAAEFQLETSFFNRASSELVFLINPDRTALIALNTVVYTNDPDPYIEEGQPYRVGRAFYRFEDVDYVFSTPPDSLETSSERPGAFTRSHLEHLNEVTPAQIYNGVFENHGQEAAVAFARDVLRFDPEQEVLLPVACAYLPEAELLELMRPVLARRPVLVEWHRQYHELMERVKREWDLIGEYRGHLDADPENTALLYLLGRLVYDREEALQLFNQAAGGPKPEPFAHFALAYGACERGDFTTALEHVREAIRLDPERSLFGNFETELLLADGSWTQLIDKLTASLEAGDPPEDFALFCYGVLTAALQPQKAAKVRSDYRHSISLEALSNSNAGEWLELAAKFEATRALWNRDAVKFAAEARKIDDEGWEYEAALAAGEIETAVGLLGEIEASPEGGYAHLGLYALASSVGNSKAAGVELQHAVDLLSEGTRDQKRIASWFTDTKHPPTHEDTLAVALGPATRKLVACALGTRYPDSRDEFFASAKILNFHRDAWYLPVRRITWKR